MRINFIAASALLLGIGAPSGPANAQAPGETGLAFYRMCQAESARNGPCESYLEGVADMLAAFGNGGHPAGICGSRYGNDGLKRIYIAWLPWHRNFWNLPRPAAAAIALRDRWPCRFRERP